MQLRTSSEAIHCVKVEPFETVIVEFCPDGVNEPSIGGRTIGFTINTMFTPDGKMVLSLDFPSNKLYKVPSGPFVLCDLAGYEEIAFKRGDSMDSIVELERIE